jgi:serine/threonine protein kinase
METKIADFGVAKFMSNGSMTTKVGHKGCNAPEMVDDTFYNTSVDVWSFGVLIWHMLWISAGLGLEKAKEKATKEEFMYVLPLISFLFPSFQPAALHPSIPPFPFHLFHPSILSFSHHPSIPPFPSHLFHTSILPPPPSKTTQVALWDIRYRLAGQMRKF